LYTFVKCWQGQLEQAGGGSYVRNGKGVSADPDFFLGGGWAGSTYVMICRMGVPDLARCLIFVSVITNCT